MKKRIQNPKLSLNKQTIANLNKQQMNGVVGGDEGTNASGGLYNQDTGPCDLLESLAIPEVCEGKIPSSNKCPDQSDKCTLE